MSWSIHEIDFVELLKVYVSIRERFKLSEIYKTVKEEGADGSGDAEYRIKAVVCFIGAHYFCFVRIGDKKEWKLYNDEETEIYDSWHAVLHHMISIKVYPTVIFYERCDGTAEAPQSEFLAEIEIKHLLGVAK